jgi:hypothetical protein
MAAQRREEMTTLTARRHRLQHLAAFVSVALSACGSSDDDPPAPAPPPTAQQACAALASQVVAGATVGTTELVAATATLPEYCRVAGLIAPRLNFEVRLPTQWNGKLFYGGGGGYNGVIQPATFVFNAAALRQGYAQVSSDSGHQGSVFDASFALNDLHAANLFGHLSVPTVMVPAREIVQQRYGSAATRSYFEACSGGGREALMNAQRYPNLFDGIIARAPAYNWVGIMGTARRRRWRHPAAR